MVDGGSTTGDSFSSPFESWLNGGLGGGGGRGGIGVSEGGKSLSSSVE